VTDTPQNLRDEEWSVGHDSAVRLRSNAMPWRGALWRMWRLARVNIAVSMGRVSARTALLVPVCLLLGDAVSEFVPGLGHLQEAGLMVGVPKFLRQR
jgi:hypothetical protein